MRLVALLAVFVSIAYVSWAINIPPNTQNTVHDVSFCELANNPSASSGKRIRVRGIYRYEFERQRLEAPTCCPASKTKIWMEITTDLDDKSLKLFQSNSLECPGRNIVRKFVFSHLKRPDSTL